VTAGELFVLFRKADGSRLPAVFESRKAVDEHLDGLGKGKGTEDNEHLRNGLEVVRYVIAALEAA
jgi:hypothetical protein